MAVMELVEEFLTATDKEYTVGVLVNLKKAFEDTSDTNLFCFDQNLEHLLNTAERELDTLKAWFDRNKKIIAESKQNKVYDIW